MIHVSMKIKESKWKSVMILRSLLHEVRVFSCNDKNGFSNPTQFIHFAVRKELDRRQKK